MFAASLNAAQAQGPSGQDLVKCLNCQGCHTVAGKGGKLGPNLTRVGQRLAPEASPTSNPKSWAQWCLTCLG